MDSDELLIEAVREYPIIYDVSDSGYHDSRKKDNVWKQISEKFENMTAEMCRKKWFSLRDSFRKSYKKRKTTSGQAANKYKPWKYEQTMSFLIPYMAEREQISNLTVQVDDNIDHCELSQIGSEDGCVNEVEGDKPRQESAPTCSTPLNPRRKPSQTSKPNDIRKESYPPVSEVLNNYLQKKSQPKPTDALASFFTTMEKTVRGFSLPLQIEAKRRIFSTVDELEMKNYCSQDLTTRIPQSHETWSSTYTSPAEHTPISTPSPNYFNLEHNYEIEVGNNRFQPITDKEYGHTILNLK